MASFSLNITTKQLEDSTPLLSDELFPIVRGAVAGLTISIALLGTLGNIFTIVVYFRMGFSETTTISLTALAMSDIGIDITAISCCTFFILPPQWLFPLTSETSVTPFGYPHHALVRTSAMITTFLSVERYLCVYWPLKIRRVITHKRTFTAMIAIFVVTIVPMLVLYFQYPMGYRFFPDFNMTLIGILPVDDSVIEITFKVYQGYSSLMLPIFTFVTVIICTILLAVSLKKSRNWRDSNRSVADEHKSASGSTRETRVVRMVVAIASVFIVSSIPSCMHMIAVLTVPEFDVNGRYSNLFVVTGFAFFAADAANTSANVFIYFNMSTKFRQAALEILPRKRNNEACLLRKK